MAISFVGGASNGNATDSAVTVTSPVGVAENDVIYAFDSVALDSNLDLTVTTAGYTTNELADLYANDSNDTNLGAWFKLQGPTPDSSVTFPAVPDAAHSSILYVLRGVDTGTPQDATTTTATGTNGAAPDPAAITTVTPGAWVLAAGASSEPDPTPTAPTNYTNLVEREVSGGDGDTVIAVASREIASPGAENPGAFGGIAGDTSDSWAAITVAVRPAATTINGTASITEAADTLSSAATLLIKGTASVTGTGDTLSSATTLLIRGVLSATEAGDTLSATGVLPITGTLSVTEAGDTLSAQGAGQPVTTGSLDVTEADDSLSAGAVLAITGTASIAEAGDTLAATATIANAPLAPVFGHVGGDDPRLIYERKQREWQQQLRRIIDQSWAMAHGLIDPVTLEPIPPPDYSIIIQGLLGQALSLDGARREAFIAEQTRQQEDEAVAVLLLAA